MTAARHTETIDRRHRNLVGHRSPGHHNNIGNGEIDESSLDISMDVSMDNSRASSVEPHDVSNLNINENDQKPTKKASISDDEENSNLSSGNFEGDSNKTRQRRGRKAGSNLNKPGNGNRGDTKSNSTSVSTFDNRPKLRLGKQSSLEDSGNDVPMTGTLRLVQISLNMSEIV